MTTMKEFTKSFMKTQLNHFEKYIQQNFPESDWIINGDKNFLSYPPDIFLNIFAHWANDKINFILNNN